MRREEKKFRQEPSLAFCERRTLRKEAVVTRVRKFDAGVDVSHLPIAPTTRLG